MDFFCVLALNAVTIICFTILSIHFNNPWLVLLALFFFQSYEKTKTITPENNIEEKEETK